MAIYINIGGSGGGGADRNSSIVVVSGSISASNLLNARTVVAGDGMQITDSGPGGSLTFVSTASIGPQGPSGSQGPTGSQGIQGPQGPAGSPFIDVVQIASSTTLVGINLFGLVSTSVGALSVSLPPPATWRSGSILLKDIHGSASVNPFTVYPTANAKIDGVSSSYPYYANFGAVKFITDGLDWFTW